MLEGQTYSDPELISPCGAQGQFQRLKYDGWYKYMTILPLNMNGFSRPLLIIWGYIKWFPVSLLQANITSGVWWMVQVAAEFNIRPNKHILISDSQSSDRSNVWRSGSILRGSTDQGFSVFFKQPPACLMLGIWTQAPFEQHYPAASKSMTLILKCCWSNVGDLPHGRWLWLVRGPRSQREVSMRQCTSPQGAGHKHTSSTVWSGEISMSS